MPKVGNRYVFRDIEFWSSTGLIYSLDYRDGIREDERFNVCTRSEFAARAIAINDQAREEQYADERHEMNNLVIDMCKAVKDAKRQGDPMDPKAAKQLAWQNRKAFIQANYNPGQHSAFTSRLYASTYDPGMPVLLGSNGQPVQAVMATDGNHGDRAAVKAIDNFTGE